MMGEEWVSESGRRIDGECAMVCGEYRRGVLCCGMTISLYIENFNRGAYCRGGWKEHNRGEQPRKGDQLEAGRGSGQAQVKDSLDIGSGHSVEEKVTSAPVGMFPSEISTTIFRSL